MQEPVSLGRAQVLVPDEISNSSPSATHRAAEAKVGHGRFTLKKILGQGGMGQVWLAQDNQLREFVALKFLPPQIRFDPAAIAMLQKETTRTRKLTYPNIIRIHDFHQHDGEDPFIAMEFVDGQTLQALRFQQPNELFTWEKLAPWLRQLCDALDYAHGEKIVHRDLKPANLMLGSDGRLKLADFGIATVISDSATRATGTMGGTPVYMSPQQMDGKPPQPSDDIYSLGATLYELLTGTPPFHTGQIVHQVLHSSPTTLSERLAENKAHNPIPPAVEAMIMACLSKDDARRPQSARAVADWIGFQPTPHPKSLAATIAPAEEQTGGKKMVWLTITLLALILLGGGGLYWKKASSTKTAKFPATADDTAATAQSNMSDEQRLALWKAMLEKAGWNKDGKSLYFAQQGLTLDLTDTAVEDLSPLRGMPLAKLGIERTKVTDLNPLKGMPLINLSLPSTRVSDLRPLVGMPLTYLDLRATAVTDLSPLKHLPIRALNLHATAVRDITPLKGMSLEDLTLSGSRVTDLTPLAGMPLKQLGLGSTFVTDIKPLQGLPLESLTLSAIPDLQDIAPLKGMKLTELHLGETKITDISALRGMPLVKLNLYKTAVTDVSPLADCRELEILVLPPRAKNVSALRQLPNLKRISYLWGGNWEQVQTADEFWKTYDSQKK